MLAMLQLLPNSQSRPCSRRSSTPSRQRGSGTQRSHFKQRQRLAARAVRNEVGRDLVVRVQPQERGAHLVNPDAENACDELKNQWGLGGFTTQDIKRCQTVARTCALVYRVVEHQAAMAAVVV